MTQHTRRRFLKIGGTTAFIAFAGCGGSSNQGSTSTPESTANDSSTSQETATSTPTPRPTATPTPTAAYIETAKQEIGQATVKISKQSDKFGQIDGGIDFQTTEIRAHLDRAGAALRKAKQQADEDQKQKVEKLQKIVEVLQSVTDGFDHYAKMISHLETGNQYFESDRYQDTINSLKKAKSEREKASESISVSNKKFKEVDIKYFKSIGSVDYAGIKEAFKQMESTTKTMKYFISGYIDLTKGFIDLFEGLDQLKAKAYEEAKSTFEEARMHFANSHDTFKQGESVATTELKSSIVKLVCLAKAGRDGSKHYREAAKFGKQGDREANQKSIQKAKEALNRCG